MLVGAGLKAPHKSSTSSCTPTRPNNKSNPAGRACISALHPQSPFVHSPHRILSRLDIEEPLRREKQRRMLHSARLAGAGLDWTGPVEVALMRCSVVRCSAAHGEGMRAFFFMSERGSSQQKGVDARMATNASRWGLKSREGPLWMWRCLGGFLFFSSSKLFFFASYSTISLTVAGHFCLQRLLLARLRAASCLREDSRCWAPLD